MPTLKDISLFFRSDCCNKTVINNGRVPSLVETLPEKLDHVYEQFNKLRHLDLQEICITYKPKYHKQNPTYLYTQTRDFITSYMKKHEYFKPLYIFYPEFTSQGILHLHGIVYFDNANDYWTAEIKRILNNKFGLTKGKKIYNLDNYWTYINKDIHKQKFTIQPFHNIREEVSSPPTPEAMHEVGGEYDSPSARANGCAVRSLEQPDE